jgi:gamma-glutamyltranspeptidase/glutathione hydrolase
LEAFDEVTGHAGAIVRRPDGVLEGAADPRADGVVAAF